MLEPGVLYVVDHVHDAVGRFRVMRLGRLVALQPGTCYVAIAIYNVMGLLGWNEVKVLVLSGELAGAVVTYGDSYEHRTLSLALR